MFTLQTGYSSFTDANGRHRQTALARVELPLTSFFLAAGTPLAAFADGASDTPGLALDDAEAPAIRWNNHAAPLAVWTSTPVPEDRRPGTDIVLKAEVSKTGATVGDVTTLTVAAFATRVGDLRTADADFGGASNAVVPNATTKTKQLVQRTLTSANIPDVSTNPGTIGLSVKPTGGTLGTDDFSIHRIWLEYEKVLLPSG